MVKKTNVDKNAEMEAENKKPKTRIIKGKVVEIIDKTPEERKRIFVQNINHELDRVGEWSVKLARHATSTTYPLSDKAIDAIVAQYDQYMNAFHAEIDAFKNKGKVENKVGTVSADDIAN